jgi:hypothetical protein
LQTESHLRVFRPSRSHLLDTTAERLGDGWRLTGVQRTERGGYLLDFARRRNPPAPQLRDVEGSVLVSERALADEAVELIACRLASGWRLMSMRRSEDGACLLDFAREHGLRTNEVTGD